RPERPSVSPRLRARARGPLVHARRHLALAPLELPGLLGAEHAACAIHLGDAEVAGHAAALPGLAALVLGDEIRLVDERATHRDHLEALLADLGEVIEGGGAAEVD